MADELIQKMTPFEAATAPLVTLLIHEDGYSKAILRMGFWLHSLHSNGGSVTAYISNMDDPDLTSETDWFEAGSGTFLTVEKPSRWLRVKGAAGDKVFLYSLENMTK